MRGGWRGQLPVVAVGGVLSYLPTDLAVYKSVSYTLMIMPADGRLREIIDPGYLGSQGWSSIALLALAKEGGFLSLITA